MLLMELGNRRVKVSFIRNDDRVLDAEAEVGGRKIMFSAVYMPGVMSQYWNVVFSELYKDYEDPTDPDSEFQWAETVDLTGSGSEFEVLSMISTCMKELLKKNPQEIRFSAKAKGADFKRVSIYRRLADKLLSGFEREEDRDGGEVLFKYTKPAPEIEL